jgi:hypothetical protein
MADINDWIDARLPAIQTKSGGGDKHTVAQVYDSDFPPLVLWTDRYGKAEITRPDS